MIWWIYVLISDGVILKQFSFLLVIFFDFSMIFPRNACFLCALCGNVTEFFSFDPKYTVQNPLWKIKIFPEFINVMIGNNLSYKSGAKSTLCYVAMNVFLLLLHICICTWPFCFAVTWYPSATWMYYLYLLMILEWNPKLLVSCGTLLLNTKSIWSIANCHHTLHFCVCHY